MGKGFWRVWAATLLFFAAFYSLMIPLPLYLTGAGLPDWQVSFILGALGIASLIVRPLAGILADRSGRQPVMILGTLSLVLGAAGVSLVTHPGLLFGLRILQAAGYVAFTTASTALISDLAIPEKRASAMAIFGVAANVAMTTVPAAVHALIPIITLAGAFWLSAGLALAGGLLARGIHAPAPPGKKEGSVILGLVQVSTRLWLPALSAWLFGVGFGAFFQFLPLLTERRNLGSAGLMYSLYGASIILTRLLSGRFLDRLDQVQALLLSFPPLAIGLLGFALAESLGELALAIVVVAAASGILHPSLITLHVKGVSPAERGRATAVFYLAFDLGIGLGAWLFSPIFQAYGLRGLYQVAAVAALLGFLSTELMRRQQRAIPI